MKITFKLVYSAILLIVLTFLSAQTVSAASYSVSGKVSDSSGVGIENAQITVTNTITSANAGVTITDSSGNYSIIVIEGMYSIQVTPPSGSEFSSAVAPSYQVISDSVINFTLVPPGSVTLSGHVYGPTGNVLSNQTISLIGSSGNAIATSNTDSNGNYSLRVAPGTYTRLNINVSTGLGNSFSLNIPQYYDISVNNYVLNQSTVLDITIPVKKVSVHVQNGEGNPIANAELEAKNLTLANSGGLSIGGGISNASGQSSYFSPSVKTDSSGNATLWLVPTNGNRSYVFTVKAPVGSIYETKILSNVTVTDDTNLNVTLQEPVTLSGIVYGPLGNAVPNQLVSIIGSSGNPVASATTNVNGSYSLQVAAGIYSKLSISMTSGNGNNASLNIPQYYDIFVSNYSISQNTNLDITIPARKVIIHVDDDDGSFLNNIELSANEPSGGLVNNSGLSIGGNILNASGSSQYFSNISGIKTDSFGNITLWLLPTSNNRTYKFIATPPSGSNYTAATLANVTIANDINLNITMKQPVTLSGYVFGPLGNPLPNQTISLINSNGSVHASASTNSLGEYLLNATSGIYSKLLITSSNNTNPSLNAPQFYEISVANYSVTQDKVLDITVPAKKVTLQVQNPFNILLQDVELEAKNLTVANSGGLSIGGGITNASGQSGYFSPSVKTNSSGEAVLWLLPNDSIHSYTFTATPPPGSIYNLLTLNNIKIISDQTEIISLQYNHATPITTATLVTQKADGKYSNPTTVTLTASAASEYTVANTYYKVDGGVQQTYTSPFTVTGDGEHSIEYWSADNSGVQEAHKTKTFTIYVNKPPTVAPLSGVEINEGETYIATGSFTDQDSTSWTATVDYGDIGGGPEPLTLDGNTFSLNHQYATAGVYTVTVIIKDEEQNTGTTTTTITVNGPPQIAAVDDKAINEGQTYTANGSFTDNDSTSWTATVNYGDGLGAQPLVLSGTNFSLSHTYQNNGNYTVAVTVTDAQGASGLENVAITVVNVAPSVTAITASLNPIAINTAMTASASFTDAGVLDTHTAVWNWGDGTTSVGTVSENNGTGAVLNSHSYTTAGVYEITLTVTDNDNGVGSSVYQYQTVYDANAGWAAGSKEFDSLAGAVVGNAGLTGKASFGFQVKYMQGDMVPSGKNVEFSFPTGNIDFTSSSYQWLVVTGTKATFKATGTLNGVPGYTILVSAIDQGNGQQGGLIRVQIKNPGDTVVYDTQSGAADTVDPVTPVSKGKIAVH